MRQFTPELVEMQNQLSDSTKLDQWLPDIARRLAFLQLDATDQQRLRTLASALASQGVEFVEQFYHHLFSFSETARFLQDRELVERLKRAQQEHLKSMLDARWDEDYLQRRHRVGDAHAHVGIEPQTFLGAYNQYLQFVLHKLSKQSGSAPSLEPTQVDQFSSLLKAVFLDIGLTLDSYFHQATHDLRHALEMLFQANTELHQFAQLTSHDLKTPLATVANLCEEVLDEFGDGLPSEARQLIEAARNRTLRMSATIGELLSTSASLQGSATSESVSSRDIIADVVEQLRPQMKERNVDLVIAPELPTVLGDRVRIREAFFNLLSNAIKFMDKSPGRIAIDVEVNVGECIFCIADNGPGIPKEDLGRLFAPFSRLPAHQHVPGTGLGLYFTRQMIEHQGGRVWVESEAGRGSRFFVLLKLAPLGASPTAGAK